MKYCGRCKVNVANDIVKCPLCHHVLKNGNDEFYDSYPKITENLYGYNVLLRIFIFLSILVGVCAVVVNLFFLKENMWSIIVVVGIIYSWVTIVYCIKNHANIAKRMIVQFFAISIFLYVIDAIFGNGWALNYIIPYLIMSCVFAVTVIVCFKPMLWRDYMIYQLIIGAFGFVPISMYGLGWIRVFFPSILCCIYSALTLLGTIIFADKKVKNELKKRFHF